jgi:uncharacterized protein (TIGR02145 family)
LFHLHIAFMKHIILLSAALQLASFICAQAPSKIPYQAVLRDGQGEVLANQTVTLRFTIRDESANGIVLWTEQQITSTNAFGLAAVKIGAEAPLLGIEWQYGAKFLQVELQTASDFVDLGTQQMLSVPYALYADHVAVRVSETGDTLWIGEDWVVIPGVSAANAGSPTTHSCGMPNVHNPDVTYGELTDQEGNVYRTVIIGGMEWMAENLNVSTYRNGDPLLTGFAPADWQNALEGAWTYYNGDEGNACPFGRLYNWYTVLDNRGICPTGWRVPNETDWSALEVELGGQLYAGGKMKTTGTEFWLTPNLGATNESGFSGLPGGRLFFYGDYGNLGDCEVYWSSTSFDASSAWVRLLDFNMENLVLSIYPKKSGFHIRCIRE